MTIWMKLPPARTYVAVDDDRRIVGTSEVHPEKGDVGLHVMYRRL